MATQSDLRKELNMKEIRKDFPIFSQRTIHGKPLIYLDNAATSQRPRQVIESITHFYEQMNANVHRAVHTLSYEASCAYEDAHKKVAKFIGAKSWREIVFTRNATEAMNLVAYAWGLHYLQPGDEIVVTVMEHHSDIVPWFMLRKLKGVEVKFIDVDAEGYLQLAQIEKIITPKTKLVGVVHASNVLGIINPIEKIIARAKQVGAVTLIDAAQSAPHISLDVQKLDCDFLAVSGHKMLAPTGIGFLYGKRELLEEMDPFLYGGDMIKTVTTADATFNELPWKFEAGTPNIADGIALGVAVDYLTHIGLENIFKHEQTLLNYAFEKFSKFDGLTLYGPRSTENRLAVLSFNLVGVHPHDVASQLDTEGIAVRSGHHCAQPLMQRLGMDNTARASCYLYNTEDEIDALIDALKRTQKLFRK